MPMQLKKIVSGGQTGADRAALDWAISRGVDHGGWCPAGRKAEDGPLDPRYKLQEMATGDYRQRTRQNVLDSEGTLITNIGPLEGGSLETYNFAQRFGKPVCVVQLDTAIRESDVESVRTWLVTNGIRVLNVAGPRESKRPGIYRLTFDLLEQVVTRLI